MKYIKWIHYWGLSKGFTLLAGGPVEIWSWDSIDIVWFQIVSINNQVSLFTWLILPGCDTKTQIELTFEIIGTPSEQELNMILREIP
jgi:hypothetical protein